VKLAEGWFFRPLDEFVDHECYTDQMVARAYVWDVIERGGQCFRCRCVMPEFVQFILKCVMQSRS